MKIPVAAATTDSEKPPATIVLPSHDDSIVRGASTAIGGPMGKRAVVGRAWWNPIRIMLLLAILASALGAAIDSPCIGKSWTDGYEQFSRGCYSDIVHLYWGRGIDEGVIPYVQDPAVTGDLEVEYPVLTGAVMYVTGLPISDSWNEQTRARVFYGINAVAIALLLAVTVWATALTVRRRPWDAAMVALAPGFVLAATINWDLWAVAATSLALLAWARRYPVLAGLFLGLGASFKFYPALLIGPLLILCLRSGRLRQWLLLFGSAVFIWLAANVPIMFARFEGWKRFYVFSSERGADYGSPWLVARDLFHFDPPVERLNLFAGGVLLVICLAIAALILMAPRRPRLHQVAFLVVAAFALTNKVYSPQFVVWLIPLAVLARPRWRDFLWWQAAEVVYFFAVWWYIIWAATPERGLPDSYYWAAIALHVGATCVYAGFVVRDILKPECDPVRSSLGEDDPGGGCLDGAPDEFVLGPARSSSPTFEERPRDDVVVVHGRHSH
ncbi:MAG TPA: glycosyltransferase 87 family protein [Actinomycetes bacterium]|nr:glycosyltransferase 87 family protein [Actinomycetes bacterium]